MGANSINVAGYVAAPGAVASKVWKTDTSGNPAWRDDADTDTGVTGVTLATIDSVGAPLLESIATRELTLTSTKYVGGSNVGYVPEGGTATTYLKGDGTWATVPTGLQFKGTWSAAGTTGGSPDLTALTPAEGWLYIVSVAGDAEPNGPTGTQLSPWAVGDWCVYSSSLTAWTRVPSSTTGVDTVETTDGTYIDLTPDTAVNGAVMVTADLSATGTQNTTTFLRGDNTWSTPNYIPNENETYDLNAGAKVGTSVPINLTSTSGNDDSLVNLKQGTNITLTRGSATEITIAAADTDTGVTGVTLAVGTSTGAPLTESITTRELTLTSMAYAGAANVGYVPAGGSATKFLRGDATWVVPTNTQLGVATTTVLGGIELGSDTVLNTAFVTGNTGSTTRSYPVQLNAARQAAVYVPWTSGGTYSWTVKDDDTGSSAVVSADSIEFVTATGELGTTLTEPATGAFVMTLTSPNTTYGTVSTSAAGLAPTLPSAHGGKFLRADATWEVPPSTDTGIPAIITIADGSLTFANSNVTATTLRTKIGAGTSNLALGATSTTALAGNTTTISSTQASDITANNAKVTDTGIPAIIVDDTAGNMSFGNANVTAATVRAQIGAGTGDGDVTASSTTTFTNKSGSNSQWTNDEGYTTNTGTTTADNTQTFTNKSGSNSQWTNDEGYSTTTGTVTPSSTDTFTNKSGNISMWTNDSGYTTNTGTTTATNTQTFTNKSGNISQWTNDSGYITSYTEADTLQSVTARGDTTNQRILMNGSGSDAYLYVTGNAATTAPTNSQGMAFVYNNSGGSRENEIYFNPGIVTPAENATYYFSLINEYLNSSSSNARVTDTLFKLYGNGNLELTGPTATTTIANTYWRMPKSAAPGTGYYLSKHSSTIDLVWTAPPTTGDITSVTAGTGMTGGGTSGGVTLNVIGGNGITANANDITMSGSYTGDLTITGDAVTDSYRFRANHANPTTSTAALYDQASVGATISAYRFAVRSYDGTNMLASALFTDTSFTVVGDVIAYGSPSDVRLKENIKPIESALDKVSKLQGVTFDWKKSDSILDIKEDIGFIAQDVQKVIPELVRENKDGMLSMRHQGIAPILLEAIKELKQEIEELKSSKCNCKCSK